MRDYSQGPYVKDVNRHILFDIFYTHPTLLHNSRGRRRELKQGFEQGFDLKSGSDLMSTFDKPRPLLIDDVIYVWPLMELSVSKFLVSVANDDSIIQRLIFIIYHTLFHYLREPFVTFNKLRTGQQPTFPGSPDFKVRSLKTEQIEI